MELELEYDNIDPRHQGYVAENATVDARQASVARVREGGRRGVRDAGGTGSLVVFFNVDNFLIHFP